MIKYYAWFVGRIYTINDVKSESDHYITTKHNRRIKKVTDTSAVFDTFEEAKQWLLDKNDDDINKLQSMIEGLKKSRADISNIKHAQGTYDY